MVRWFLHEWFDLKFYLNFLPVRARKPISRGLHKVPGRPRIYERNRKDSGTIVFVVLLYFKVILRWSRILYVLCRVLKRIRVRVRDANLHCKLWQGCLARNHSLNHSLKHSKAMEKAAHTLGERVLYIKTTNKGGGHTINRRERGGEGLGLGLGLGLGFRVRVRVRIGLFEVLF